MNIHDLALWFHNRGALPVNSAAQAAWLHPHATAVQAVSLDSRSVRPGGVFVALAGSRGHGQQYLPAVWQAGAVAALVERPVAGRRASDARDLTACAQPIWAHADARRLCGELVSELAGHPSRELDVVAITGTNGKTTTAHFLRSILMQQGGDPALIGTTGFHLARGVHKPATHTTPDAPTLQALLAEHRSLGGGTVIMEASSHALEQERLAGTEVDIAVFTNLSRDHLDYHGNMEDYAASKARLFHHLSPSGVAILNADDREHPRMAHAALSSGARVLTTSLAGPADLWASHLVCEAGRTRIDLSGLGLQVAGLWVPVTGSYNVANLLQAMACARWLGIEREPLLQAITQIQGAPGRMEPVDLGPERARVWVDYAHTPEALERALQTLQAVPQPGEGSEGGQLTVVFGCGGDRDQGKRHAMGAVAGRLAHRVIVTSDNPRSEDPAQIAAQILKGVQSIQGVAAPEVCVELDRRAAIRIAVRTSRPGDSVLVAGKGHEPIQIFADHTQTFDDRLVAREVAEEVPQ